MLKALSLGAALALSATSFAYAQAPATTNEAEVDVNEGTPPDDISPDLATEPLANRSEHEGFSTAFTDAVTSERLTGAGIYSDADEKIGTIAELVLDESGQTQEVVVDIGGFLGIGAKSVALPMSDVELVQADDGDEVRGYVTMTREELEALPEHEA